MPKYTIDFKFEIYGTKKIEAKNIDDANRIADRLEKEIWVDDIRITDDECEVQQVWEDK